MLAVQEAQAKIAEDLSAVVSGLQKANAEKLQSLS